MDLLVFSHSHQILASTLATPELLILVSPATISVFQISEAASIIEVPYDGNKCNVVHVFS